MSKQGIVSWSKRKFDLFLIFIALTAILLSLGYDYCTGNHWFQRSGAITIACAGLLAYLSLNRHWKKAENAINQAEWTQTSKTQKTLDNLTIFLAVIGTLISSYGDIVFNGSDTVDDALSHVENCICYKSTEGQQLKPWELAWKEPDKLRQQLSHCVCKAHIDLKSVKDPSKYVIPGTELR